MGKFDSRNSNKMKQRREQAKKKERAKRVAEAVRAQRRGSSKKKSK